MANIQQSTSALLLLSLIVMLAIETSEARVLIDTTAETKTESHHMLAAASTWLPPWLAPVVPHTPTNLLPFQDPPSQPFSPVDWAIYSNPWIPEPVKGIIRHWVPSTPPTPGVPLSPPLSPADWSILNNPWIPASAKNLIMHWLPVYDPTIPVTPPATP